MTRSQAQGSSTAFTFGEIHVRYAWPMGEAEKRFFDALRLRAVLTGARCNRCGRVMVPPRSFCEQCFERDIDYIDVPSTGTLTTFAESHFSLDGRPSSVPFVIGIVRLDGTDGGLLHRIDSEGGGLAIGASVEAVFEPERHGTILDIRCFKLVE